MVTRLDCSCDNIGEVSLNETNILNFLGAIEERTNEILNDYYLTQVHGSIEDVGENKVPNSLMQVDTKLQCVLGVGPKLPMAADSMNVNPPKLLDYSSDENSVDECDIGSRPLSLDEVKSKMTTRIIQQRRKAPRTENQTNGRRGSILTRRRTSLLAANAATFMAQRRSTINVDHVIK